MTRPDRAAPDVQKKIENLDKKLSDLYRQINNLDRQYQAQIYGIPGYERYLTGELAGPIPTARSAAKGFRGWIARKWHR